MNSQILIKINNFLKSRLIEISGILLILASIFLLFSVISYSPSDPNFIYRPESTEIKNLGGFYGSVISDFLLQSFGLISFLLIINIFDLGCKIIFIKKNLIEKKITLGINNLKIFFVLIYTVFGTTSLSIFYNSSFWLIDNGNGGFVGKIIKDNIYKITNIFDNHYFVYSLAFAALIFFISSLNLSPGGMIKILSYPFTIIGRFLVNLKKNKKNTISENINSYES